MKQINDILQKQDVIIQILKEWGYKNPRLFKTTQQKYRDKVLPDKMVLCILVDNEDAQASSGFLRDDLEKNLKCCIEVCEDKADICDDYNQPVGNPISLNLHEDLLKYYGSECQFAELSDDELLLRDDKILEHVKSVTAYGRHNRRNKKNKQMISIKFEEITTKIEENKDKLPELKIKDELQTEITSESNKSTTAIGMKRRL